MAEPKDFAVRTDGLGLIVECTHAECRRNGARHYTRLGRRITVAEVVEAMDAHDRLEGNHDDGTAQAEATEGGARHGGEAPTGSRMELVRLLDSDDEKLVDDLLGWQYAAVARALAEAGAVHPQVHTSARIANYLERHGWQRIESPQPPPGVLATWPWWSPPDPDHIRWIHPSGIELDAPLSGDEPGYAESVRVAVNRVAWAASGKPLPSHGAALVPGVLLEIAQQPDEVAW
jgi:hypothetical protein